MENTRLEGVEKTVDSKLLTSDYSRYLKEMSLGRRVMEEEEPSPGGKAKAAIITGKDRSEISAAAAKSTTSPPSSHPAPPPGLAHQSFSSQNANASVGSSIERLPSKEHAERKSSKHKKDKVSELRSLGWLAVLGGQAVLYWLAGPL